MAPLKFNGAFLLLKLFWKLEKIILYLYLKEKNMSTNFYRIPTEDEMLRRKKLLVDRINDMELSPRNIERGFEYVVLDNIPNDILLPDCFDAVSPWAEFFNDMKVHLGKRSSGWKFTWNFHNYHYYKDKETLFEFIRSGRVVDEYGDLIDNEEFIKEALEWGQPDGHTFNEEYIRTHGESFFYGPEYHDKTIDGLNVSSHTNFC
jgi:hypothetical protein